MSYQCRYRLIDHVRLFFHEGVKLWDTPLFDITTRRTLKHVLILEYSQLCQRHMFLIK